MTLYFKKILKRIVKVIERELPSPLFNWLYAFAFPKYKAAIRMVYWLKLQLYKISGNTDKALMSEAIYKVMPYTLVGIGGLEATYHLAMRMNCEKIRGAFVELGVARGGCAALIAKTVFSDSANSRAVWLFDSFEGLPEPTKEDFDVGDTTGEHVRPLPKGSCLGTFNEVSNLLFDKFGFPKDRIILVKGWFQNTLPVRGKEIGQIALLRIDGDWYESTKCCLDYLYGQVTIGGAVIIDDYQSCYGCKKAVDEFLEKYNIVPHIQFDGRGGCYFIKI